MDNGKLAYHLQDEDAEAEVVAVLTYGATLYDPGNWEHVENARDRYYDAVRRHLRAARAGEILDAQTGLMSLAGAACSLHFLIALELKAHPELLKTFPARFRASLETARQLRAERLSPTRVDDVRENPFEGWNAMVEEPEVSVPGALASWTWEVHDVPVPASRRARKSRMGEATTREAARKAAEKALRESGMKRGKIVLSQREEGFTVSSLGIHAPEKKVRRRR